MRILHQGGDGHYHLGGDHDCHQKEHTHAHTHGDEEKQEGPGRNINIDAAYLHVLGDLLMSVGVIIASIFIFINEDWVIADPICTYLFSIIVCFTVIPVVKNCLNVLFEGSPEHLDIMQM